MTWSPARVPPVNQCGVIVELTKILSPREAGNDRLSRQAELLRDNLGSAMRIVDRLAEAPVVRTSEQPIDEKEIKALLKLRRHRDRFFGAGLFADPAWDILLELYASALGQYRLSVSHLCQGAAVPATTALRWINHLEGRGMIVRRADPTDGRRQFLMLSVDGLEAMNSYFRTVPAGATFI